MKKYLASVLSALVLTPLFVTADVGESSSGSFAGTITAIETERDSITVESVDKQVKMFSVSPSSKSTLEVGQTVVVGYVDDYQWPLKTTSVSARSSK
jgi:hypothetical protein